MSDRPKGFSYVALFLREDEPRCSPMGPGGFGRHFVYLTNRNHCTYLFDARPVDGAFEGVLSATFPMGYAQLYVLEKLRPGISGPATSFRTCVFQDPARTFVGSGATVSSHPSFHEAAVAAKAQGASTGIATILTRVFWEMTWH